MAIMAQPLKHPHSGIYYFRREVPEDLREVIGKREWKRSLHTKELAIARPRHAACSKECEEIFWTAREELKGRPQVLSSDAPKLADRWAKDVIAQWETDPDSIHEFLAMMMPEGEEPYQVPASDVLDTDLSNRGIAVVLPYIQAALMGAGLPVPAPVDSASEALRLSFLSRWHDLCSMAYDRHCGDWRTTLKLEAADKLTVLETKAAEATAKAQAKEAQIGLLSEAFAEWAKRKRVSPFPDEKMIGEYEAVIDDFIELHGDLPLDQIEDTEIWDFADALLALPKDKRKCIRSLPLVEQIRLAAEDGMKTVSPRTVKKKMRFLGAVISTGKRRCKFKGEEPVAASKITAHLESIIGRTATTRRMYYNHTELITVFSSPLFTREWQPPKADYGEALYWIPLILLYTGARLGEIATLYSEDVSQDGDTGLYFFDITSHTGESKKTANSIRKIPMHPDLITLGLLDYAANRPKEQRLFPKMGDPKKNRRGAYITRAFTDYLRNVVKLEGCEAPPLHGLRHSFTTYGARVGIPQDTRQYIQGHKSQREAVANGYNARLLEGLADELKKFPSIATEAGLFAPAIL